MKNWFTQGRACVAAVSNKFCSLPGRAQEAVLSAVLPGYAEKMAERGKARRGTAGRGAPQEFKVPPELTGDWVGQIRTHDGDFPITLSFKEPGDVQAWIGEQGPMPVANPRLVNGWLSGSIAATLDTLDGRMRPHRHMQLDLKLRGDVLNGAVVLDIGNAISYWTELRRK